jgi:folate-binding protein YgfZ
VDRDVVRVSGPDALVFLQGQVSQDVAGMAVGASVLSLVLQPAGKVDALVRITRTDEDALLVDVDGGYGDAVHARLSRFKLRVKAELVELSGWRCLRLLGANNQTAPGAMPGGAIALPTGWPTLPGVDILGEAPVLPAGATQCGLDAYEAVRIAAGVPRMGAELTDRTIPAEADVVDLTVSFTKGCFTGQELVARIDSRGGHVPRLLRRVTMEPGPVPPVGAALERDGASVGALTSVAFSAIRQAPVALAYVRRDVAVPSEVSVVWDGGRSAAKVEPRA